MKNLQIPISDELRAKLKAKAALASKSLKALVVEILTKEVSK